MEKQFYPGTWQQQRAFSPAVATKGGRTIWAAGHGGIQDIVTMTVFIIDARYGDRFIDIRKEFFPSGEFPASALITVAGLARPNMMIEIQCVAVVPE